MALFKGEPTTPKPDLKFDHDPRAASSADCPAEKCADRSRRLAWVDRFDWGETLNLNVTGLQNHVGTSRTSHSEIVIYRPTDELLQSLVLVATGELARREEARRAQS